MKIMFACSALQTVCSISPYATLTWKVYNDKQVATVNHIEVTCNEMKNTSISSMLKLKDYPSIPMRQ